MARKSMSVLDVYAWVSLWRDKLEGARLDNVYRPSGVEGLLLKFKWAGGQALIVAEPGVRIHLTSRLTPSHEVVPKGVVAVARRHLRGRRLQELRQVGFDKIVELVFSEGYRMLVELLPRGVIAVVSPEGKILATTSTLTAKDRVVRPGVEYKLPPWRGENPFTYTPEKLAEESSRGKDLVRGLVVGAKVPGEAAEEAIYRCGLDLSIKPSEAGLEAFRCIAAKLREILDEASRGRGYVAFKGGEPVEADPFKPTRFSVVREYDSLDQAMDDYFHAVRGRAEGVEDPEVAKLRRSMEEAKARAESYRKEAERLRKLAEVVAARYQEVDEALRRAWRGVVWGPVREVKGKWALLEINGEIVRAERGEDAGRLILRLYREAGEMEAKARRAEEAWREAEEKLKAALIRSVARRVAAAARSRRRFWFERYHWTITSNGLLVIGGRDASQNESVVKRYLTVNDIFMHADIHGAPAVVLKVRGKAPGPEDLRDAAVIAAAYSKAWKAGAGSVSVYWVRGDQVSFTPPSGEYLAKGAIMVYGKRNYIHGVEVALWLGLALLEEAPMVIVGGESFVSRYSLAYVKLVPGDLPQSNSEAVKEALARVLDEERKPLAMGLPEEEVSFRLPGKYRILWARRGRAGSVEEVLQSWSSL